MAKANSKDAWDATSWKELQELTTVEKITKSLRAEEKQRLAHKKYYLRKDLILARAKEKGVDKEVDREIAEREAAEAQAS